MSKREKEKEKEAEEEEAEGEIGRTGCGRENLKPDAMVGQHFSH